jgi:drug/metabolite transporter (DMT)-like permease
MIGKAAEFFRRAEDWVLLVVPGVIWGASFLFIAESTPHVGPFGVSFLRILIGFATLALFPKARKSIDPKAWPKIALVGFFWMALPLSLFPFAEQTVSSAVTGMLNGSNPLFVAVVATLFTRKLPARAVLLVLLAGLVGTVLIAMPTMNEGSSSAYGVGLIMLALCSYGVALNIAGPLQQTYGALPVLWRAQMVALILTAPFGAREVLHAQWTLPVIVSMALLGALGTGIAYIVLATAAGRLGATKASTTTFLIPPVSILLGYLLRNERVALISIAGCAICLSCVWLMKRTSRPPKAVPQEA